MKWLVLVIIIIALCLVSACNKDDVPVANREVDTVYIVLPDTGFTKVFNVFSEKISCDVNLAQAYCVSMGYEDMIDIDCRTLNDIRYLNNITCWKR